MKYNVCMNRSLNCLRRRLIYSNRRFAKELWGEGLEQRHLRALRDLTERFGFSVARGDLQLLNGAWYVTHSGLLRLAYQNRTSGIRVQPVREYCNSGANRWVFKATVYRRSAPKGFVGYGDADPSNVSPLIRGAEMRVAETRAVNRALRKAYGIGVCSVEELRSSPSSLEPVKHDDSAGGNASATGQPRLRDKLCLLIRRYELDSNLVKRYAADFCGTETLRDASRDLVEAFVSTVAKEAANDREALICKLNSYCQPEEVRP
jgi:hypothetical protein